MKLSKTAKRRQRIVSLITLVTMLFSMIPNLVPGVSIPAVSAHNLDASAVYIFFDPATQAMLDARIASGTWTPGTPLILSTDELGLIIKAVPDNGTTTGVGGYTTFYVPDGVQVVDAAFVMPDGNGNYVEVATHGQAAMPAVGAGGDSTVSLVGTVRGPNVLGTTSAIVADGVTAYNGTVFGANTNLGTTAGVYGDTGIFYSTDPSTALGTYTGGTIKNNSGDTVGFRTFLGTPMNKWDAWQMAAFGIAGTTNPAYPGSPIIDSNGRGYAPWGLANAVAGPQSGYAWEFDLEAYKTCTGGSTAPNAACIKTATQDMGPWQRIQYPGSQISDDPPGARPLVQPYTRGADGSTVGYALSPSNPLPATTGQANGTPNAVRWAFGQLTYEQPEFAWVKIKVTDPTAVTNASGCPDFYLDTFGGDAGGDSGGKDHIWRYYDPNSILGNACLMVGKPATRDIVKVGDTFQYNVKVYNLSNFDMHDVVVTDLLPSGVDFISAVPAQNSGPNPLVWNVGSIPVGGAFLATLTVKATGSGVLENKITVTAKDPSNTPITTTGIEKIVAGSVPLLVPTKSASPTSIAPGGSTQYTIQISNVGSGPSSSPTLITEYLPAGFTYVSVNSVTVNGASYTASVGGTATVPTFEVPTGINAGSKLLLTFTAQSIASIDPGPYCNSYSFTQDGIRQTTGTLACVSVGGNAISDTIWRDWDGDGVQDSGEEGIAGIQVCATPSVGAPICATTDADGKYLINGLVDGTYTVAVTNPPAGYTPTYDLNGTGTPNTTPVTVSGDVVRKDVDFGYLPAGTGSIGDLLFEDKGNDGLFNGTDTFINKVVTVWLYEDTNGDGLIDPILDTKIMTATTSAANGLYSFTGLAQGLNYIVKVDESDPDLAAYFTPNAFSNSTGLTKSVTNLTGAYLAADFGYFKNLPSSIGDTVFIDKNGDGIYDANVDAPLANITVTLYQDTNGDGVADGPALKVTSTDPFGQYLFSRLGPDTYLVVVDTADSDLPAGMAAVVSEYVVTLPTNTNYLTADFPFRQLLTKTASPASVQVGGTITYTLRPYYAGSDLLENVRIIDPIPTGTTYVAASANAGGTYGTYVPIPAVPGSDPEGGPSATTQLDTSIAVSKNYVTVGGSVNVTLTVKQNSGSTINSVSPVDFAYDGGNAACTGPTPASANVPTGATGSSFAWSCTLPDISEVIFGAGAGDAGLTTDWPTASSASVLSAPDGGPNRVVWNFGSNTPGISGETIVSGYTAGIYAFRGGNTQEFSKYNPSANTWASKAQPTNGIEKGGSLTGDGAGILYGLEGNSKIFYKYTISTNTWSTLGNISANANEGGAVQYLKVGATEYVFALLGNSKSFRRYTVGGSWANMKDTPANIKKGGALTTDGTYIYALRGDRQKTFWRCNATTTGSAGSCDTSWTSLADTPGGVGWGGALTRIGNYIYATRGDGKTDFWRCNYTTTGAVDSCNTGWAVMASTPGNVADGGALATDGTYVYALQGKTKVLWRYNPATNAWTTRAAANFTGNVGQGGALAYDPGVTPIGRFSDAAAAPTLVSTGDTVKVTIQFDSSSAVNNVIAGALNVVATGGATRVCGGGVLKSANDDIVDINDPVIYEWTCTVTAGTTPGSLTFSAGATGDGPTVFPTATANSVLVSPVLSFKVTANAGAPILIKNTGLLVERSGSIGTKPSNTTETPTASSIGDRVWVDLDGDGVQDSGEPGLSGVTVRLYDSGNNVIGTAVTDSSGLYHFYGLSAAAYSVKIDLTTVPTGYLPTTPTSIAHTLTSAEQYLAADFGLRPPGGASVGDTIWIDANEDGVADGTEARLPGVTVKLYDSTGTNLLATTTTNASGLYTFTGLYAGNYVVSVDESSVVTTSHGVTSTLAAATNLVSGLGGNIVNPTKDVAVNVPTDSSAVTTVDFGYNWSGQIGDLTFYDNNGNGLYEPGLGETPAPLVTQVLYYDADGNGKVSGGDPIVAVVETDANGAYLVDNLPPGNYVMDPDEQTVESPTTPGKYSVMITSSPETIATTLSAGAMTDLTVDSGFIEAAIVEGYVFHDVNTNGLKDGETGLPAVSVTISGTDIGGNPVNITMDTDATGEYKFIVAPGTYTISYNTTDPQIPGELGTKTTPISTTFTALSGSEYKGSSFNFGLDNTGAIGDLIWNDANGDGIKDPSESGLKEVTVQLYNSTGSTLLDTTVTTTTGGYLFAGLADGTYVVKVITSTIPLPVVPGFTQTGDPTQPGVTCTVCDNQGSATVTGGGSVLTVDFGYQSVALLRTISGRVYDDLNNNNNDDAEPGMTGVDITVQCDTGTFTTITDGTGAWSISGIPDGSSCTVIDADEADLSSAAYVGTEAPTTPLTVTGDVTGLDFGYNLRLGSISGSVCATSTGNLGSGPCDDATETPLQAVTVTLTYFGVDGILGTADDTTTVTNTSAGGTYLFPNLEPGTYQIVETDLPNYSSLGDTDGGNANVISPATLTVGQNLTGRNFEDKLNFTPATISGTVWNDLNGDGTFDAGEPPIASGVVITLSNGMTTTTDVNGVYTFTVNAAGIYTLTEGNPIGFTSTGDVDGGNPDSIQVNVTDGAVITGRDFFDARPGALTGTVFYDLNGDGTGTTGMAGITVTLSTGAVTTADVNGVYTFTNLMPGSYTITETNPAGYASTKDVQGSLTDDTIVAAITSGTTTTGQNFWDQPPATAALGDLVWNDLNKDGIKTANEPGIPGAKVIVTGYGGDGILGTADDTVITATTDINGIYTVTNRLPDTYNVLVNILTLPEGFESVTGPDDQTVSLAIGETKLDVDFPYYFTGKNNLGDYVWTDTSGNGNWTDEGAQFSNGINGVTVTLYLDDGDGIFDPGVGGDLILVTTVTTNTGATGTGFYNFLIPAVTTPQTYWVAPTGAPLAGLVLTSGTLFGDAPMLVTNTGTANTTVDFGYAQPVTVSGGVYNDPLANKSGTTGLAGVVITATRSGGSPITTTTNASGLYTFTNLIPGSYTIVEGTPVGYESTGDVDGANDDTITLTLTSGNNVSGQNFWDRPGGSIGDLVWYDTNGNGVKDGGEPGIPGVVISLTNSVGAVITKTTNASGIYSFSELLPGVYTVTVASGTPSGSVNTSGADSKSSPYQITLAANQDVTNADFGYHSPSSYLISKTREGLDTIRTNAEVTYTIRVTNTGKSWLTTVPLSDSFDSRLLQYFSASVPPMGNLYQSPLLWTDVTTALGDVAPNGAISLTVTFITLRDTTLIAGGVATNTVTAVNPLADPDGPAGPLGQVEVLASKTDTATVAVLGPTNVAVINTSVRPLTQADSTQVQVGWKTVNEVDVVGFHLYRRGPGNAVVKLTTTPMLAKNGGQANGAVYSYVDEGAVTGVDYGYVLQILLVSGGTEEHPLGTVQWMRQIFLPLVVR